MSCIPGPAAVVGVGVDVVEIGRVAAALARHGPRFLHRIYAAEELGYCTAKRPAAMHACLAARFAAKEAVMKALGTGRRGVSFCEVVVQNRPGGRPVIYLRGRAQERARVLGIDQVCVSITHGRDVAVVVALAVRGPGGPENGQGVAGGLGGLIDR